MSGRGVDIGWNDIFDRIWCIHYLPYRERYADIRCELDRIGILHSVNFEWHYTVENRWNRLFAETLLRNGMAWALTPSALCVALEHY